jgi:excisionase family DNA binding protein
MTLRTAAKRLGIGELPLRRAVRSGEIPTYAIGGWPRLRWSDLLG